MSNDKSQMSDGMMYNIVYQAYGLDEIVFEAIYSILSLYRACNGQIPLNICLVVYTDRQDLFQAYLSEMPIQYIPLSASQIQEWKGDINFVHRVKIKMLQHLFQQQPAPTLYVDTDTVFRQNPLPILQAIETGHIMMHTPEYRLNDAHSFAKKLWRHLKGQSFNGTSIPQDMQMWNAGALGLPTSASQLLPSILALTDDLYRTYPKHVMEQLAFSLILAKQGTIQRLDDALYHYWNFKEFRLALITFFQQHPGQSIAQLADKVGDIDPELLIQPKLAYLQRPKWQRIWLKWMGKQWKMTQG